MRISVVFTYLYTWGRLSNINTRLGRVLSSDQLSMSGGTRNRHPTLIVQTLNSSIYHNIQNIHSLSRRNQSTGKLKTVKQRAITSTPDITLFKCYSDIESIERAPSKIPGPYAMHQRAELLGGLSRAAQTKQEICRQSE